MTDDPFAPPSRQEPENRPSTSVVLVWMVTGGLMGFAASLTAQLFGLGTTVAMAAGLAPIALGATLGWLVFQVDRQLAASRPALLDASGRRARPVHAAVYLVPLALCVPTIAWLVIVVSLAMTSLATGLLFASGGFVLGWSARRIVARHVLTEALQLLELGDVEGAEAKLEGLAQGVWATRHSRDTAHLNLGLLALTSGDFDLASRHYEQVREGIGGTFARAGAALVFALEDRFDAAEDAILEALSGPGAMAVQGQVDTVRLLLALRQKGAEAARELGERLLEDQAGDLFLGLLAFARLQTGDEAAARQLATGGTLVELDTTWRRVVPEIAYLTLAVG